jgi:peptidoglycan LD-endopeptidase LytH
MSAPTSYRLAAAPLAVALSAAGCTVVRDASVDSAQSTNHALRTDTVARVDTLVRVDTVVDTLFLTDTVVALGPTPPPSGVAEGRNATALGQPPAQPASAKPAVTESDAAALRAKQLAVPVAGKRVADLLDTFNERRGTRLHGALDIPAPRGTPVLSADAGRVLQVDTSAGGGLSVYVGDPSARFIYYYAHLDAYRPGLANGQEVRKGEVLGYVGTTGNAPPNVPHLHFAIARSDDPRRWWDGTPLDPLPIYRATGTP